MKKLHHSPSAILFVRLGIAVLALLDTVQAGEYPWLARRVWWQPGAWETDVEFLLWLSRLSDQTCGSNWRQAA